MTNNQLILINENHFKTNDYKAFLKQNNSGAIVEFSGCVRADQVSVEQQTEAVQAIVLEHYPVMAEKALQAILGQAFQRWPLHAAVVHHRVGKINAGEDIVYVGISAAHRKEAIAAVDFIMDFLKNDVPIWKKHISSSGQQWVEQKSTDSDAKKSW